MANSANDRRIDYIEMGVGNIERSKAFYGKAFGWTFTDYGPDLLRVRRRAAHWRIHHRLAATSGRPADGVCTRDDLPDLQTSASKRPADESPRPIFDFPWRPAASISSTPTATSWRSGRRGSGRFPVCRQIPRTCRKVQKDRAERRWHRGRERGECRCAKTEVTDAGHRRRLRRGPPRFNWTGWRAMTKDEELIAFIRRLTDASDTILLGRKMTRRFRDAIGKA